MKKNVLVFPCGSEIGLEIYRSLSNSTHFKLIGASSVDDHGAYVYERYIGDLPLLDDPDFISQLNEVIERERVDFIFPAHDSAALLFSQAAADQQLRCTVITSPVDTCTIARSKRKTYDLFREIIPTPRVYEQTAELIDVDFPLFLKPDVGQGSKGTHLVKNNEELNFYVKQDPTLLCLEYLPGREYTIDCFTDRTGKLLFAEGRERVRISNGISVSSTTTQDRRFYKIAQKINETLTFRGVWFFQVKERESGELVLMEIAPRVAGTMGLVRCKGVNLALLSLFDAMDYEVCVFENSYTLTIDRALHNSYKHNIVYRHVYLDFDDLVVCEEKVNPEVIAFVFQCFNNGVQVHLLTRHKQELEETLKKRRLHNIFDEVIWIRDDTPKYEYIVEKDAIFIDDSFAERKAVRNALNIPVFDAHMIESLKEV